MLGQFEQVQVRESEAKELEQLMDRIPCDVQVSALFVACCLILHVLQGGTDTSQGKVNILLQAYI